MIREFILRYPQLYQTFQVFYGMNKLRKILIKDYFSPQKGDKVLDIGCGPADILNNFDEGVIYTGIDISERYLEYDAKHYAHRNEAAFVNADVKEYLENCTETYDFILFLGSSQNFDDEMIKKCYKRCHDLLNDGGKLIILDGVYTDNTNWIESFLLKHNRGPHIRTLDGWKKLILLYFTNIICDVRKDLEYLPNCQLVVVATK